MAAETYGTVADANTYHADRGNAAWAAASTEARQAALVRGTAYIDGHYYNRFGGSKTGGRDQALQWPRTGVTDADGNAVASDTVPIEVVHAAYEAALRELAAPGSLAPDFVASTVVKRKKVDVLEVEYAGAGDAGAASVTPVVGAIDAILAPLLTRVWGPAVYCV